MQLQKNRLPYKLQVAGYRYLPLFVFNFYLALIINSQS